MALWLGLQVHF